MMCIFIYTVYLKNKKLKLTNFRLVFLDCINILGPTHRLKNGSKTFLTKHLKIRLNSSHNYSFILTFCQLAVIL